LNSKIYTTDLVKVYKERTVVNQVSIEVNQGEIVGLLGPNGAGKTTSFYMVVGFVKPNQGNVYLDQVEITNTPMYKRAQMGIGYLPQEASIFRKLSVEDNIAAVLEMTKLSKKEQKDKLEELLNEFRLTHVRKNLGGVLSGGERRRTEIARALATNPKFILLDEPFAGIDPIAVEDIQGIVARLKNKNIGILITDHNVNETLSICDRAYLLIDGKIYKHGTAEELAEDEAVRKLYLGRNFELKRKDYLLEENTISTINYNSIINALESLANWAQKIMEEKKVIARENIGSQDYVRQDLGVEDYYKFNQEVVDQIREFSTTKNDKELLLKADGLEKNDLYHIGYITGIISFIKLYRSEVV
jgi:lipopolysaccharide export system ATP-binding protein